MDGSLIVMPTVANHPREPLHPPVDGDVVNLDAALDQQFLDDVPLGQVEPQNQRTATTIARANVANAADPEFVRRR